MPETRNPVRYIVASTREQASIAARRLNLHPSNWCHVLTVIGLIGTSGRGIVFVWPILSEGHQAAELLGAMVFARDLARQAGAEIVEVDT